MNACQPFWAGKPEVENSIARRSYNEPAG